MKNSSKVFIVIGIVGIILLVAGIFIPNSIIQRSIKQDTIIENPEVNGKYVYVYNDNSIVEVLDSFYDLEDFNYWSMSKFDFNKDYNVTLRFKNDDNGIYAREYGIRYNNLEDLIAALNNIRAKGFE